MARKQKQPKRAKVKQTSKTKRPARPKSNAPDKSEEELSFLEWKTLVEFARTARSKTALRKHNLRGTKNLKTSSKQSPEEEQSRREWLAGLELKRRHRDRLNPPPKLASDQLLSEAEIEAIWQMVFPDQPRGESEECGANWINSKPSVSEFGQLVHYPEAQFLHWMNLIGVEWANFGLNSDNPPDIPDSFNSHLVSWLSNKVGSGDAEFFANIAFLLKASRERRLAMIKPSELDYAPDYRPERLSSGRKMQPYDLDNCAKEAVWRVLSYRVCQLPDDGLGLRRFRISRDELQHELRRARLKAGLKNAPPVSNHTLSRQITKFGISRFMAK
jgi:hypothetical protein